MPNDVYSNIVRFAAVAPAAVVALPHTLNVKGVGKIPDIVARSNGSFTIVAVTNTTVTVRNDGAVAASCDVWCWWIYSVLRVFDPITADAMTPAPFVIDGAASGGGSSQRFSPPEQWAQNDVPALTGPSPMSAQVSTNFDDIKMTRAGSIVGLNSRLTEAITAGTLTVRVTINGAGGTLNIVHTAGANPTGGQATQLAGVDNFVAGDLIGISFQTDAAFLPITTDLEAWLEIEEVP